MVYARVRIEVWAVWLRPRLPLLDLTTTIDGMNFRISADLLIVDILVIIAKEAETDRY